jgi:hypothetical protein
MKTTLRLIMVFLLVPILLTENNAFGQYHAFKINALGLISGVDLGYEGSVNKMISIGLSGQVVDFTKSSSLSDEQKVTGWGITPEVRIYPLFGKRLCPAGLFAGTYFRYRNLTENSSDPAIGKHSGNDFNLGLCAGYKIYIHQFFIEFLGGIGHGFGSWNDPVKNNDDAAVVSESNNSSPFKNMRIEMSLGFMFPSMEEK